MNDRQILAKAMGRDPGTYASNHDILIFDPFTDAHDERAVLRFMCGKIFSVRREFFIELDRIIQERTEIPGRAAWPEAMMFIKDGDIARAALKVIEK